jgi:hypothetical protein
MYAVPDVDEVVAVAKELGSSMPSCKRGWRSPDRRWSRPAGNPVGGRVPKKRRSAASMLLPLVLPHAALSRPTSSGLEREDEVGEARQLIESVDELLHAGDGAGAEHHTRELTKLRPNFVLSIGILEVADTPRSLAGSRPPPRAVASTSPRSR